MTDIKHVAAGFSNDAEKLLQDFIREGSLEFSVFARIWKKYSFSLIYAFRPNGKELRDFTLEIFQLSINFLKSSSLLYQVGGTFLLYSLYRNQIVSSPLKIRIISSQFKTIMALLDMSLAEKKRSLHYVISYLVENAFVFVSCPKLKGPNSIRNEPNKGDEFSIKIEESDMKHGLTEISKNGVLHEIDSLYTQYENSVSSLNSTLACKSSTHTSLKDFAIRIDNLLKENELSDEEKTCASPKTAAIGSRRARIKAAAFSHPVYHKESGAATSCVSEEVESSAATSTTRRRRRVRRRNKKVGRPKKWASEDSLSEKELEPCPDENLQGKGLSGRRRRRPRGPQFTKLRRYYADDFAVDDDLNVPSTSYCLPVGEYLFSCNSDNSEEL